jgi:hypothetical protein
MESKNIDAGIDLVPCYAPEGELQKAFKHNDFSFFNQIYIFS